MACQQNRTYIHSLKKKLCQPFLGRTLKNKNNYIALREWVRTKYRVAPTSSTSMCLKGKALR